MHDSLRYLQNFINSNIPMARNMDIQALAYSGDAIRLSAPLVGNTNHHATAFGGSIATLGIVAGWSLIHLRMLEEKISADLVVNKTECSFLKPVRADFEAHCSFHHTWQPFKQELMEQGRARLVLSSQIICQQQTVAELSSSYAARLDRPSE